MEPIYAEHTFPPVYQKDACILILGSFPSVQSRKQSFYYMHPQNRFWRLLGDLFQEDVSHMEIPERINFLHRHNIALYDVISSCNIIGSSDSKITDVTPANLSKIMEVCPIQHIFLNGKKASTLFHKYFPQYEGIATTLPSTSPANAQYRYEMLKKSWSVLTKYIKTK